MQYFFCAGIIFDFRNNINQGGSTDYTKSKWILQPPASFNGNDGFFAVVRDSRQLDAWLYYYNYVQQIDGGPTDADKIIGGMIKIDYVTGNQLF